MEKQTQNPQLPQNAVKCRFFAQYFGQRILNPYSLLTYTNTGVIKEINAVQLSNIRDNDFIELKSLSKITDEDAYKIPYRNSSDEIIGYYTANSLIDNINCIGFYTNEEIDSLRALSYAVPFMGYSVDDLVSFGWVQLL
jgi:recombinational DNA repair protein RecT